MVSDGRRTAPRCRGAVNVAPTGGEGDDRLERPEEIGMVVEAWVNTVRVTAQRVVATNKRWVWIGSAHRHISELCVEGGRRVDRDTAIGQIERGEIRYFTLERGVRAEVVVVPRCEMCSARHLRTRADGRLGDDLLEVKDC